MRVQIICKEMQLHFWSYLPCGVIEHGMTPLHHLLDLNALCLTPLVKLVSSDQYGNQIDPNLN